MKKAKDIFIDANVAKNFSNPVDPEYKKLILWLIESSEAHIVMSKKLYDEYGHANIGAKSSSNIIAILKIMGKIKEGKNRIIDISNDEIDSFYINHPIRDRKLKIRYNRLGKDQKHIPLVLLSCRKFALTYDQNFSYVLTKYPGFKVRVEKRPEDLPYISGAANC